MQLTGSAALNATGDQNDNVLLGNGGANRLDGEDGNDVLSGAAGADTLDGGAGEDGMLGGGGNDLYIVDDNDDLVTELTAGAAGGVDTVHTILSYKLGANIENGTLLGDGLADLTGNSLANLLTGNAQENELDGGVGADTMVGGFGGDTYYVGNPGDVVTEGLNAGYDYVYSSITYTLTANVEQLSLTGGADRDGTGNTLANTIYGNEGGNRLDGAGGNDTLVGDSGNDTLVGGAGNDVLIGSDGDNTLDLSSGNDLALSTSLSGHDVLNGFDGNPTGGQDVLDLDELFDQLGVAAAQRAGRVGIVDNGASVDVWIDTDGNKSLDLWAATINTTAAVTVGADVLVGTL